VTRHTSEIDAIIAPRAPSGFGKDPRISWLFDDPIVVASDYFKRTRIFPIMHVPGLRKTIAEVHPWLPTALYKAFDQSKAKALDRPTDVSAMKVMMPFIEERLRAARQLMGWDLWPYGIDPNRYVLESFLKHHHAQGLSSRVLGVDELFPSEHARKLRDLKFRDIRDIGLMSCSSRCAG
jgi:4,5-dihydroxyphthalate decarboxylase